MPSPETEQLVAEIATIIKDSKEFVITQAPDVAREIILWAQIQPIISVMLTVIVSSITVKLCLVTKRSMTSCDNPEVLDFCYFLLTILGLILSCIFAIEAVIDTMRAIKAIVTPKLFLLDYLAKIVKG